MNEKIKIIVHVPLQHADKMRLALGEAGAGRIGEYSFCSFSTVGKGRFLPSGSAKPHIGQAGVLQEVDEESIEVVCDRVIASQVLAALKQASPYEEPAYEIFSLMDESQL